MAYALLVNDVMIALPTSDHKAKVSQSRKDEDTNSTVDIVLQSGKS